MGPTVSHVGQRTAITPSARATPLSNRREAIDIASTELPRLVSLDQETLGGTGSGCRDTPTQTFRRLVGDASNGELAKEASATAQNPSLTDRDNGRISAPRGNGVREAKGLLAGYWERATFTWSVRRFSINRAQT